MMTDENDTLVPKLCLGMPTRKLCFLSKPVTQIPPVNLSSERERELKPLRDTKRSFEACVPKQSLGTRLICVNPAQRGRVRHRHARLHRLDRRRPVRDAVLAGHVRPNHCF